MPQDMNVLCCYSCKMYQVHIVKKARKWQCKVCNEKQSLQRVYYKGTGKDCRVYVQNLNMLKQSEPEQSTLKCNNHSDNGGDDDDDDDDNIECYDSVVNHSKQAHSEVVKSKWSKYLNSSEELIQGETSKKAVRSDNEHDSEEMDMHYTLQESSPNTSENNTDKDSSFNDNPDRNEIASQKRFYSNTFKNEKEGENNDNDTETETVKKLKTMFESYDDFDL